MGELVMYQDHEIEFKLKIVLIMSLKHTKLYLDEPMTIYDVL